MEYSLSYTAASLRIHDTYVVAEALITGNTEGLDEKIGNGKVSTGKRIRRELEKRLKNLTPAELIFLRNAGLDDARKMALVAICKTYQFIYQFIVEVLREKVLKLDYQVSIGEYLSFFQRKAELSPKLEELSPQTKDKIRTSLFRMLEEARLIDSTRNKVIQPQFLSEEFLKILNDDDPSLLRIFFLS